jgi:two-component system response regulator YesN
MIRTLIVDDEKYVRKGLIAVLPWDSFGFNIVGEASSVDKALEFISLNDVDLVVTDLTMPVKSGFDLMEELSRTNPEISIVVLTCHQDFSYIQEAMRFGAIDFIVKTQLEKEKMEEVLQRIANRVSQLKALRKTSIYSVSENEAKDFDPEQRYSDEIISSISSAVRYIKENIYNNINQEEVARTVNISRSYLSICFKDIMKKSFCDYVKEVKIQKAKELLIETSNPIYLIAQKLGFKDEKYFSKMFREHTGMTPSDYRIQKR